ncbi:type IV secretion system protein [Helicobacter suis]|uniref:type IV secretion system protein n=1 Tax=Helicobacter suis TaxID=104628 RepID=UPI0013D39534|nr:VirB8/TrbF family protein [Helicobacter suis]
MSESLQERRAEFARMAEQFSTQVSFEQADYKKFAKLSVALLLELLDQKANTDREQKDTEEHTSKLDLAQSQHISRQKAKQELDFEQLEQKIKSNILPQMQATLNAHLNQVQTEIEGKIEKFTLNQLDLGSVFRLERKITQVAFRLALLGGFVVITLSLAIVFMMPLVRVEPLLIDFANADKHFAIIQRADAKIEQNEALMRALVGSYILNRETINHIDDQERYENVRLQSTSAVFKTFEGLVAGEHSIYTNENIDREVKIINISIYKKGKAQNIAVSDVVVKLFNQGYLSYEKRYRITLSFAFLEKLKFDYHSMPKNPTGFEVLKYSITEIATIKALDTTHKIHKLPRSKIEYTPYKHEDSNKSTKDLKNDTQK